jgi:uncharacterized SAM-binding protein YcdF (DUF218 family)
VKELDLAALVSFDGSREALVVLITVVVAAFWASGFQRLVGAAAAASAALWGVVAFTPLCGALAAPLVLDEVVEPSDAVFVSSAALSPGEQGRAEERSRLLRGAELLARAKAPVLVLVDGDDVRADTAAATLRLFGLGTDKLVRLPTSRNTREQAVALARLAREKGWKQLIAVTSPLHSSRLAGCLSHEDVKAVMSPSQEARFNPTNLRRASDRINAFGSVIHEQMGSLVYRLRGWS